MAGVDRKTSYVSGIQKEFQEITTVFLESIREEDLRLALESLYILTFLY